MFVNELYENVRIHLADGRIIEPYDEIKCIEVVKEYKNEDSLIKLIEESQDDDCELINRVRTKELECLYELKRVCDANGLKLFLIYGTLLGAVRNGRMIHGDDDIDVALLRGDYDKLISLSGQIDSKYFLQTYESDNSFYGGYAKLRNSNTTAIVEQNFLTDCNEGIGIDIFPIDRCFTDEKREEHKANQIKLYQRLAYASVYGDAPYFKDIELLKWKAYKYLGKVIGKKRIVGKLEEAFRSGDSDKVGIYAHYSGKSTKVKQYGRHCFENPDTMMFEGMEFCVPKCYKAMLRDKYGYSYMKPVSAMNPEEMGLRHAFYDPDRPYTEYKQHFASYFSRIPAGRKLVLVGDKAVCDEYGRRHGAAHPAKYVTFDELSQMDYSTIFVWVCGFDYHALCDKMRELGCKEYFLFHYDPRWMRCANPKEIMDSF